MKIFIAVPINISDEKVLYEKRMQAIHKLKSEGHEVAYTVFEGNWWSEESMRNRGAKNVQLMYLSKAIEELSKCDAIYFCDFDEWSETDLDAYTILHICATHYNLATYPDSSE